MTQGGDEGCLQLFDYPSPEEAPLIRREIRLWRDQARRPRI